MIETHGTDTGVGADVVIQVKNTGNVSVKDGVLEDDHADLSGETFELAAGEEARQNLAVEEPVEE